MLDKLKNLFSKGDEDEATKLPKDENIKFVLTVDNIKIAILQSKDGEWVFNYTQEFIERSNEYKTIAGFPDVNKEYRSESLWPFFRIRIPGLKQPAVREILDEEQIDIHNEAALLKRFGYQSISNPYLLSF